MISNPNYNEQKNYWNCVDIYIYNDVTINYTYMLFIIRQYPYTIPFYIHNIIIIFIHIITIKEYHTIKYYKDNYLAHNEPYINKK